MPKNNQPGILKMKNTVSEKLNMLKIKYNLKNLLDGLSRL